MVSASDSSSTKATKISMISSSAFANEEQNEAFLKLKSLCEKDNLYWPASELEGHPNNETNDDITLIRFLRARSWDPQAAYKQYSASAVWRRKYNLDSTYDNADIQAFERMNRVQPQWTGRRDKNGIPVMVYVLSEISPSDLTQLAKDDPELSSIFLPAEYVTRFTQRLCTTLPHPSNMPIDKSNNIIDLSAVGLRKFWALRGLLQKASNMATAHYPETVERIIVVGAPYFFPTIWSLVVRWFDPATTRKILVVPHGQATAALTEFIEPNDLPVRFGGTLEWKFGDHPVPDTETAKAVGRLADRWVDGPIRYIPRPEGDVLMAVGTQDGKMRRELLAEFHPK